MSTENRIAELESELAGIPNSLVQNQLKRRARILEELSRLRRQQYAEAQAQDLDDEG
jgi:hypothetical protein